ncbi:MAG TPA: YibE/F family protein [Gaiellaceae bacterium]|jgi:uncharacterized membrane protein
MASRLVPRGLLSLVRTPLGVVMVSALVVVVAVTAVGLVVLWPHGNLKRSGNLVSTKTVAAEVTAVEQVPCAVAIAGAKGCQIATVKVREGRDKGTTARLELSGASGPARAEVGDRVRVFKTPPPPPGTPVTQQLPPYSFADFDRRAPMLWLAVAFVVLLLLTGRFNGLRALTASARAWPSCSSSSFRRSSTPLAPCSCSHRFVRRAAATIPVCYGIGPKAIAAWLGTAVSLLLAVELADRFTHLAHLTGASSEEAVFLSTSASTSRSKGSCWREWSSARWACSRTSQSAKRRRSSR